MNCKLRERLTDIIEGRNRNPESQASVIRDAREYMSQPEEFKVLFQNALNEIDRQSRSPVNEDDDNEARRED